MDRREALRLLATGAVLQLAPGKVFAAIREARAAIAPQAAPGTLNSQQNALVTAMAEMILPRTDTPGATDAGVAAFVDLILTEWYDDQERAHFLAGLADVDTRAQALFGKNFVDCPAAQQAEILIALGEKMAEEAEALRDRPRHNRGGRPDPYQNFYYMFRGLTLTGYYTSEVGATQELHLDIIPDRYDPCLQIVGIKPAPESR
jgi:gluconate 2-dehydrogenase gamma chain